MNETLNFMLLSSVHQRADHAHGTFARERPLQPYGEGRQHGHGHDHVDDEHEGQQLAHVGLELELREGPGGHANGQGDGGENGGDAHLEQRVLHRLGDRLAMANREMLQLAKRFAASHSTILITGESGTGKELLAQGIHNESPRRHGPFVAINCAAFPESLLESELFGYEEGAFSGSRKGGKPGLFEAAHRGTLFLDEIGDMPVSLQTRLLRVLQEREVLRLGGTEPISIDVRIIAATHKDLGAAMKDREFRTDLYYRLNILRLQTTPLRERPEDIPLICQGISQRLLVQGQPPGAAGITTLLLPYLVRHSWPGNVRELENVVERAMLSASEIFHEHGVDEHYLARVLPELFEGQPQPRSRKEPSRTKDLHAIGKTAQLRYIQETLDSCQGSLDEAARRLGISRTTLWRRLRSAR